MDDAAKNTHRAFAERFYAEIKAPKPLYPVIIGQKTILKNSDGTSLICYDPPRIDEDSSITTYPVPLGTPIRLTGKSKGNLVEIFLIDYRNRLALCNTKSAWIDKSAISSI